MLKEQCDFCGKYYNYCDERILQVVHYDEYGYTKNKGTVCTECLSKLRQPSKEEIDKQYI